MQHVRKVIQGVVTQAPEWNKRELCASDPALRARAEETLAAMIEIAVAGKSQLPGSAMANGEPHHEEASPSP